MTADSLFGGMSNVLLEHPIHHLEERLKLIKSMGELVPTLPLEGSNFSSNDIPDIITQFEMAIKILKSL